MAAQPLSSRLTPDEILLHTPSLFLHAHLDMPWLATTHVVESYCLSPGGKPIPGLPVGRPTSSSTRSSNADTDRGLVPINVNGGHR